MTKYMSLYSAMIQICLKLSLYMSALLNTSVKLDFYFLANNSIYLCFGSIQLQKENPAVPFQ